MDLDETWLVGLRPEKTKPCTFSAKSHYAMGFWESAKNGSQRRCFFCDVNHAPLLPLSLDRFPPNFPRTRVQVVSRDIWFHILERFPLRDRISRRTLFLGYPICAQPTGHGKRSATSTLFPSPSGHPTDVPFLCEFCWGMYRFPPVCLRKSPCQQWGYLDGDTVAPPGERRDTTQWAYNEYKETWLARWRHHGLRPSRIADMQWYSGIVIHYTFSSYLFIYLFICAQGTQFPRAVNIIYLFTVFIYLLFILKQTPWIHIRKL